MNWTLIKSHQLEQKCHKSKRQLQTMIPCVRSSGIHLQFQAVVRLQSDNPRLLHTQVIQGTRQGNHRSTILSHAHYMISRIPINPEFRIFWEYFTNSHPSRIRNFLGIPNRKRFTVICTAVIIYRISLINVLP